MWYIVIHDIVPTNERLHAIRLVESDRCRHCGRRDTLVHGLTECNEGMASSSNDSYHSSTILTSCAARDGNHTGRPAGCSR